MRDTDYAYAVAYTRTFENRMLQKSDYESLLAAHSFEEALHYLLDKGYGGKLDLGHDLSLEAVLRSESTYAWGEVRGACPKNAPIDILLYQNDFHNLKAAIKSVFSGTAFGSLALEPCSVPPDEVYRAVAEGKPEFLPEIFVKPAAEARHTLAVTGDGQLAEIVLDKALFSAICEVANRSKSVFLAGWVDLNIAIMDMKIALRGAHGGKHRDFLLGSMLECKRIDVRSLSDAAVLGAADVIGVFAHSGFEGAAAAARESTAAFDRWCDNELIRYVRPVRHRIFGFEPILGFLVGKQVELQEVRIILSGLKNGIPSDAIRERLRDTYV